MPVLEGTLQLKSQIRVIFQHLLFQTQKKTAGGEIRLFQAFQRASLSQSFITQIRPSHRNSQRVFHCSFLSKGQRVERLSLYLV